MPWVWKDKYLSPAEALADVDGMRARGIPVGVVIIDSPWATGYNTFDFASRLSLPGERFYGSGSGPIRGQGLVTELKNRGVRVILWMTPNINSGENSSDTVSGQSQAEAELYAYARDNGFLLRDASGTPVQSVWWKGEGGLIDLTNVQARSWWLTRLDRALGLGIDGWKLDTAMPSVTTGAVRSDGQPIAPLEYEQLYYRTVYGHTVASNPDRILFLRAWEQDHLYAPLDVATVANVGDQNSTWTLASDGFQSAIVDILKSYEANYPVVGSDIGGYFGRQKTPPTKELYLRWAAFSAFTPLMETLYNPWEFDAETVDLYRHFAILHSELAPFFYSLIERNHFHRHPVIRRADLSFDFVVGDRIFVAPIVDPGNCGTELSSDCGYREFVLPPGRWVDFWDGNDYRVGGLRYDYRAGLGRLPVFVREGSIIPVDASFVAGRPPRTQSFDVFPPFASTTAGEDTSGVRVGRDVPGGNIELTFTRSANCCLFRVKLATAPERVEVFRDVSSVLRSHLSVSSLFAAGEGWYHDPARSFVWLLLPRQINRVLLSQ